MGSTTLPESEIGVLVKPFVTGLSGSSYNYVSKSVGGKKSKKRQHGGDLTDKEKEKEKQEINQTNKMNEIDTDGTPTLTALRERLNALLPSSNSTNTQNGGSKRKKTQRKKSSKKSAKKSRKSKKNVFLRILGF